MYTGEIIPIVASDNEIIQRCSEKACPYPPEDGETLCSYHKNFFCYDVSLVDRGLQHWTQDDREYGFADYTVEMPWQRPNRKRKVAIHTHIDASLLMMKAVAHIISKASPSEQNELFSNEDAAWGCLYSARFPEGVFCLKCGIQDVRGPYLQNKKHDLKWKYFVCRRCRAYFSLTSKTYFASHHISLGSCLRVLAMGLGGKPVGFIAAICKELECSRTTAFTRNHRWRNIYEKVNIDFGFSGRSNLRRFTQGSRTNYCKKGHVFSDDNVRLGRDGHRRCRTCDNKRSLLGFHRRRAKRKANQEHIRLMVIAEYCNSVKSNINGITSKPFKAAARCSVLSIGQSVFCAGIEDAPIYRRKLAAALSMSRLTNVFRWSVINQNNGLILVTKVGGWGMAKQSVNGQYERCPNCRRRIKFVEVATTDPYFPVLMVCEGCNASLCKNSAEELLRVQTETDQDKYQKGDPAMWERFVRMKEVIRSGALKEV